MIPAEIPSLDLNKIIHPDPFYWPGYMWIWNDQLQQEKILSQIQDMASHNAMTPMVVPEPKHFRPRNMPTRLDPEYLSAEYLQMYRTMVQAASDQKMNVWLYDEGGWPSGGVCGELVKKFPELAKQRLIQRKILTWKGRKLIIPSNCLFAGLYQKSITNSSHLTFIRALQIGQSEIINIPQSVVFFFFAKKEGSYPDLLNPKTTDEFIRMTHETYKKALGDFLGTTISLIFTDEPKIVSKPPWTDDLFNDFFRFKGYDLRPYLPALFKGNSEKDLQTRIDFADWWSHRFATAYFEQIQSWCHTNHILSGGHLNGEDETMGALYHGYGHVLRALRKMDVPGVDVIWRQLWPGKSNHHFPKFASSVAHQAGSRWALSESFAVYGSGLTLAQMKWVVNYQLVRGITLFDLAVYQYSNQDWFIGGERPVFGEYNPLWHSIHGFHEYLARLSFLLSCGSPHISIAVYYPVRDIWANGPDTKSCVQLHDRLIQTLHDLHCDYDFIDDDLLEDPQTQILDGNLCIGSMKYRTVCIGKCSWMSIRAKELLIKFSKSGGKVLWIDSTSNSLSSQNSNTSGPFQVISLKDLSNHLNSSINLDIDSPMIRVCVRSLTNGMLYFLTNESDKEQQCVINISENSEPVQIDPETGQCLKFNQLEKTTSGYKFPYKFPFAGALMIFFPVNSLPNIVHSPITAQKTFLTLSNGWQGQIQKSYIIQKHGFKIEVGSHQYSPKSMELGDWRTKFGPSFSGEIVYSITFSCSRDLVLSGKILDCGDVKYICALELNGEILGKRLWPPYQFPIIGKLREGQNIIKITVTNTLANQYLTTNFRKLWRSNQLGPYHPKALKFECDSLPSGLFGPVSIKGSNN